MNAQSPKPLTPFTTPSIYAVSGDGEQVTEYQPVLAARAWIRASCHWAGVIFHCSQSVLSALGSFKAALRANSSGIYRPAAEAADEIERLRGIVPEVLEKLNDELCAENQQLRGTLQSLYTALRNCHYGRMPDEVQTAYDKASELCSCS